MIPVAAAPAAARAFDAVAESFDARFGEWQSVAAQRRAVRRSLLRAFARGTTLLELGGGTGEDARWLVEHGRDVLMTDPSPAMVRVASAKLGAGQRPRVMAAESLECWANARAAAGLPSFDGAFSNFAALNCVADTRPVARGLARLVRPEGRVLLVLFGTMSPGEVVVQLVRRDPRAAIRRLSSNDVPARLGGREFVVRYHRSAALARDMAPWFRLVARRGIGVFVPPSAAEPWISRHPRLLRVLESLDVAASRPLALLGDHVLYELVRTHASSPEPPAS